MPGLKADLDIIEQRLQAVEPYLLKAWMRSWETDIGVNRYAGADG